MIWGHNVKRVLCQNETFSRTTKTHIPGEVAGCISTLCVYVSEPFSTPVLDMDSTGELADPVAKGTLATAKQAFGDLFRWKQRVEITNAYGETRTEWQSPKPLKNPISLLASLSARGWVFFLVGFASWTADAFDFHALSIQTTKLAKSVDDG